VRPLFDDGEGNPSAVTRDYTFDLEERDGLPLLNVFGGKITTFRKLAEHALDRLAHSLPGKGGRWTAAAPLPGGAMPDADFNGFLQTLRRDYPWLTAELALHFGRLYGTRTKDVIGTASSIEGLGRRFGPLLTEAEVLYLVRHEWAETAEDILLRRTKHGLHMSELERRAFADWLASVFAT
jgi:glycerol-3-phosphate dehydrogenase